jgi:hypothetical protein
MIKSDLVVLLLRATHYRTGETPNWLLAPYWIQLSKRWRVVSALSCVALAHFQ